ncbi:hypothetical protein M758_8G189900 [Ceratodon purpureus]|nr:hypothetical protein M758_8G189900 [Ceratodon purpureus]
MNTTEDQVLAEQEALLAECKLYKGEKEPETKEAKVEEYEHAVVDGLPVGPASHVLGAPVGRSPWSTGLFSCFGNCGEHFTSDLQVCVLGSFAPCVLYGSNMERLYPGEDGVFMHHCMMYTYLWIVGANLLNMNLAPCISVGSRIALRRKYNLEGNGDCCFTGTGDDESREGCNTVLDVFTHFLCHTCALCQESRELRRRTLHPSYQPYMPMTPPMEQSMTPQM